MKKLFGLLSTSLLAALMCVGLANKVEEKAPASSEHKTLEVRDVLRQGAEDGTGNVVRKAAAAPTTYGMADAKIQVSAPDENDNIDIRFVAGIDSYDYNAAQFKISMHNASGLVGSITREVTSAYRGLEVAGEVMTASEIFGEGFNFFIAYTLKGMPREAWTNNSFEIQTGLKQASDESFTTHNTEDIKVVSDAVLADHLVFTWKPYNGNYGTMTFENNFYVSHVDSSLDPTMEGYGGAINSALNQKVKASITTEDGTVYDKTTNIHSSGNANQSHAMNIGFNGLPSGFDTSTSVYTLDVEVTYDVVVDGVKTGENTVKGTKKFSKLGDIENVVVTPEGDSFIITFDALANAKSYAYRIFNDSVSTDKVTLVSGDKLATASLSEGTYSLEIFSYGDYNAPNSTIVANAFTVENVIQVLDGSDKFVFEMYHTGNNWETLMRFKPVDSADAVTADNAISEVHIVSGSKVYDEFTFMSYSVHGVSASKSHPYYDANTGFYTVGFSHRSDLVKDQISTMDFIVKTDANVYYSISLKYLLDGDNSPCGTSVAAMYANWLNNEYGKLIETDYSPENWEKLTKIKDDALVELSTASDDAAQGIFNTALEAITAIEISITILDAQDFYDIEIWHKGGDWEYVWRIKAKDSAQAITVDSKVSNLEVKKVGSTEPLNALFISRSVGSEVNATKNVPYYDSATGYYQFGINLYNFDNNKQHEVYFLVEDDSGAKYRFHFFYTAVNTSEPTTFDVTWARDYYQGLVSENFGFTNTACYSEENYNRITTLYNEVATALADKAHDTKNIETLINTNKALAAEVEMDNLVAIDAATKKTWIVSTDAVQDYATNGALVDNNYGNGWQLNSNAAGRYYQIELDKAYDLLAMYIKWEGANCADYDIMVSVDGVEYFEAGSFSTTPKLEGREDTLCLNGATGVKYVRIVMNVPGSNYGYQAREIDLFVSK